MSDPLTSILKSLRLAGSISCTSRLRAPWGVALPRTRGAAFHTVGRGTCWVMREGAEPARLEAGDFVLFPRGQAHVLADELSTPARTIECLERSQWLVNGRLRGGGSGARTDFLCGEFQLDSEDEHPLWAQLPDFVLLHGHSAPFGFASTLRLLAAEVSRTSPGSELVVTRLLEVLVVQVVRAWLELQRPVSTGWLGGMGDPRVGASLGLIHESPERDWTVASLAKAVGTSRTVFAERFTSLVGESPLAYLIRVRMRQAATMLRQGPAAGTMISVAQKVGYGSEAAFSKAFKRVLGVSPGVYRRRASTLELSQPGLPGLGFRPRKRGANQVADVL